MSHPFSNKLFVFIGYPKRCTRQAAHDALMAVGGVVDGHIAYFTHYVVAFSNAKTTKIYKLALEREKDGFLVILSEKRFFDILEGKAEPPEKKHTSFLLVHSSPPLPSKNLFWSNCHFSPLSLQPLQGLMDSSCMTNLHCCGI